MKITKKQKYLISAIGGGGIILVTAIVVPLTINKDKKAPPTFSLQEIKNQMHIAINSKTLENTKTVIVKMYQNGTKQALLSQAQKATVALAQYIYANKAAKVFAFQLGQDQKGNQLLLLTVSSKKPNETNSSNKSTYQLKWVRDALAKVEFGILFQIYQKRLSSQQTLDGTKVVNAKIEATDFSREQTPQEKLQAQINQLIHSLTARQLNIHGDGTKLLEVNLTATQVVLAIQKIITNNDEISNIAKGLIIKDDIRIEKNNVVGMIKITIKNHGDNKIITIFGFKATGSSLQIAQTKIDNAKNGATPPTKKNHVIFGKTPSAKDANAPSKDGITFIFKVATAAYDNGEATFTYEVDANPQVVGTSTKEVSFVVSGFKTKIQQKLNQVIKKLLVKNFTTGINKNKIAELGQPDKVDVIKDIKKAINNPNAKVLILPSDITIRSNNVAKTVTIIIDNHELSKSITISGFVSIKDYLDQTYKLNQVLTNIPSSGGALTIPEGITNSQFDAYIQVMGDVLGKDGKFVMNKFAEKYKAKITSVIFPNSFVTIGDWFKDFNKITSLTIPNSVTSIGLKAFYNAKLTSLTIPDSVISIGNWAFALSPLSSLTLGNKLQTIGEQAFFSAKLQTLTIPNSVTSIGDGTFAKSPLILLTLGENLQAIEQKVFWNAKLTSLTIPNSVTAIGVGAFTYSPLTSLKLGNKLQTIDREAFWHAKLTSLTIPNSVTAIGNYAFLNSPLKSLTLGKNLQTIGDTAFKEAQLTSLIIPNSMTKISQYAFFKSSLTSLKLGDKLQRIGNYAFYKAQLTSLTIPNSMTKIGQYAFFQAQLTLLTIPNSVTAIGNGAFLNSPLKSLTLGNKLQTIGVSAFKKAQLILLKIPNSVISIGKSTFEWSPLKLLMLGEQLQTIAEWAFHKAQLTSLTIPNSITLIKQFAFFGSPIPTITIFNDVNIVPNAFKSSTTIKRIPRPPKPTS